MFRRLSATVAGILRSSLRSPHPVQVTEPADGGTPAPGGVWGLPLVIMFSWTVDAPGYLPTLLDRPEHQGKRTVAIRAGPRPGSTAGGRCGRAAGRWPHRSGDSVERCTPYSGRSDAGCPSRWRGPAHAQSSSRNCTSRVRRNPFATFQWPRTRPGRAVAPPSHLRCGSVRRVVGLDLPFRSVSQQLKDHIIVRYQE